MDKRETSELGQVLQLLDDGNAAGASALLRQLLHPDAPQPEGEAYPMWVHHPEGEQPSRVANSPDEEKKIQAEWENGGSSRNVTTSAGPVPAPGTSLPPLPGDTKRPQQPEFPAKDDIRVAPGKKNDDHTRTSPRRNA